MNSMANAQTGIQLAQMGKRAEALPYLRQAAQLTPSNAEIWLWLAHVTPDLNEYQYCVQQALMTTPTHPIANQMRDTLYRTYPHLNRTTAPISPVSATGSQSLAVDAALVNSMERKQKARKRRQLWMMITALLITLAIVAAIGVALNSQQTHSEAETGKTVEITIRTSRPVRFVLTIPVSWFLADTNSEIWTAKRDELIQTSPETRNIWEEVQFDLREVAVNQSTGEIVPLVTFIETDLEKAKQNPARLQLVKINSIGDTDCEGITQFAKVREARLTGQQDVVSSEVKTLESDRCVYVEHFRGLSQLSGMVEHIYVIYMPVSDTTLAEWHLTVIDESNPHYQAAITQIIATLRIA